jgi:signal transduction histidine kinase
LTNAAKFSPPGSTIHVLGEAERREAVVSVRDEGPGIPEDERARVFERFVQSSTTKGIPGTGLGLAIVARYVDLQGGRAWADGHPGGGAVFRFSLPLVGTTPQGAAR